VAGKFSNAKTVFDGMRFDSKAELRRWNELVMLQRAGQIHDLRRQEAFVLAPPAKLHGETRARPAIRYVADFVYREGGKRVVEDTKGMDTPMSRLKRHLMLTVHGIQVRLTR
jgi:hypothetical protein